MKLNIRNARHRLWARTARRYQLQTTTVNVARAPLTIVRPISAEEAWQAGQIEHVAEWGPYWAHLWESGLALAEALAATSLAGRSVLDIGCGLGVVGSAAARQGAEVVMADAATDALLFARLNGWLWRERTTYRQLDWNFSRLRQRFDLIVGADLIYDRSQWEGLEQFCSRHLALGGRWLMTEPQRISARPFPDWLEDRGWRTCCQQRWVGKQPIRLLICQRASDGGSQPTKEASPPGPGYVPCNGGGLG